MDAQVAASHLPPPAAQTIGLVGVVRPCWPRSGSTASSLMRWGGAPARSASAWRSAPPRRRAADGDGTGTRIAGAGVLIGLVLSWIAARAQRLYGVGAADPAAWGIAVAVLLGSRPSPTSPARATSRARRTPLDDAQISVAQPALPGPQDAHRIDRDARRAGSHAASAATSISTAAATNVSGSLASSP